MSFLDRAETEYCRGLFERVSKGRGQLSAADAVSFLRGSSLPDAVLHAVWGQCDPEGCGYLDINSFSLSFKLVALAQAGVAVTQAPTQALLSSETPLPTFGPAHADLHEQAQAARRASVAPAAGVQWVITPDERTKYDSVFMALERDSDGFVSGRVAKQVLVNSKLPTATLGQIWELSDMNADGRLDADEFAVAMSLVYKCLAGAECPRVLPQSLIASSRTASAGDQPEWVVTDSEVTQYTAYFRSADKDKDGYVNGADVRPIFKASKLDNADLARIWDLCDLDRSGVLTLEQFCLAMHLTAERVKGVPLPDALTPAMIPPSHRDGDEQAVAPPLPERAYVEPAAAPLPLPPKPASLVGGDREAVPEDILSAKREEAERLQRAKAESGEVNKKLAEARTELERERASLRLVQTEAASQASQLEAQEAELRSIQADIARMQAEETSLRKKLDSGKQQLKQLVIDIKAAKASQAKSQSTVSRLASSNEKVDHAVKQYGTAPALAANNGGGGAPRRAQNDPFAPNDPFSQRQQQSNKGKGDAFSPAAWS